MPTTAPRWVRSTRCASGTCVEAAAVGDTVLLRDSKNPEQPPLTFTRGQWADFLTTVATREALS